VPRPLAQLVRRPIEMVHCLSLARDTHRLIQKSGEYLETACGLALQQEASGGVFCQAGEEPTCQRCRAQGELRAASSRLTPSLASTKISTRALVERMIGNRETGMAAALLTPELVTVLRPDFADAIARLHELFADWQAEPLDIIADSDRVFARYRIKGMDVMGLLGAPGQQFDVEESVLLHFVDGRIARIIPVSERLGMWLALTGPTPLAAG
jgi:SnoaL-like polyketide cyclase